ncbi:MAG: DUF4065 domain-containing protein [Deltaproteobacteria bacterium]|nr:DUF4065 domain-containing protein [Deltaproteobacteria bacterium]
MASIHDVAKYIVNKQGSVTAMKLQKLVYYAQAWSLVWDEKSLFSARIEAWANGPVSPELYRHHYGEFFIHNWRNGKISNLTTKERTTIDSVLKYYGHRSAIWLSELTHNERPWKEARKGLGPNERGNREITTDAMYSYYSSL